MQANYGHPAYTIKHQMILENVQRRATKFILNYPTDLNYKQRFLKLSILPLEYRRDLKDVILLFKSRLGLIDLQNNLLQQHSNVSNHVTTRRGRGRSIIRGAHFHIFVFTDCKNNRFQKKLMMHNTNI